MNIAARLDQIIQKRKPLVKRIKEVEKNLIDLIETLSKLENLRQRVIKSPDSSDVTQKLQNIMFEGQLTAFKNRSNALRKLRERFDRESINIGVVGLMGQGKSTLLKSLSGLSNEEIPAQEGSACTAVRSSIYYEKGETKAKVIFHDEYSFLKEVIQSYYDELELPNKPLTLDDFANNQLPSPPQGSTKKAMYDRLKNEYHLNIKKYRHLLKEESERVKSISREEIRDYVVHQYDENNNLKSFNHLAVKQVEIYCEFPKTEVEKIGLVDIPGLGDFRVGDEKLMLETLGREVDLVLFVKRPDSIRYQWTTNDTELYEKGEKALDDLSERAFMVLNHTKKGGNDNFKGCQKLKETIKENHLNVVDSLIADCSNSDAAHEVLDIILRYLVNKIESLDKVHARKEQNILENMQKNLEIELQKANAVLANYGNEEIAFSDSFEEFEKTLSNELAKLQDDLKIEKESQQPDKVFQDKVNEVFRLCETDHGIPSIEEIEIQYLSPENKKSYKIVYCKNVAIMRCALSKHFLKLNEGLKKSLENLKKDITEIFVDQLKFGNITEGNSEEFLKNMTELLAERNNPLELGFRTLAEAKLSYEGIVLADIREHFDKDLNPDEAPTLLDENIENPPQKVENMLNNLHKKVLEESKKTLEQYLDKPSRVKYFLMQEFLDRVLYAKDIFKKSWRNFLQEAEIRKKIWPEFSKYEERKEIQHDWRILLNQAKEINQPKTMRFLN